MLPLADRNEVHLLKYCAFFCIDILYKLLVLYNPTELHLEENIVFYYYITFI